MEERKIKPMPQELENKLTSEIGYLSMADQRVLREGARWAYTELIAQPQAKQENSNTVIATGLLKREELIKETIEKIEDRINHLNELEVPGYAIYEINFLTELLSSLKTK